MDAWNDNQIDALLRRLPAATPTSPEALRDEPWYQPCSEACDDGELIALQRGLLEAERAQAVYRHMADCRACRDLLVELGRPEQARVAEPGAGAQPRTGARIVPLWQRPLAWAAPVLAVAAAVALVVWLGPGGAGPPLPARYQAGELLGGVQAVRGEAPDGGAAPVASGARTLFVPAGRIELSVLPVAELQGPAPPARAFVAHADGPLRALAVPLQAGEGGVWFLDASAAAVLGPGFGPRTLVVAVASSEDTLAGLAGRELSQAREEVRGVRWLSFELQYEAAPPSGGGPRPAEGP